MIPAPLHAIAHGRSGDKGERSNISVIPYRAEAWPVLLNQVTEAAVLAVFAHRGASAVRRYELLLLNTIFLCWYMRRGKRSATKRWQSVPAYTAS